MKFSELDEAGWPDLQPYLDTCLLPVTGLTGEEAPWEMADFAAAAGEWLIPLEQAFRGRTVTLPAYHYYDGSDREADKLNQVCTSLRSSGFKYVVLICGRPGRLSGLEGADLVIRPESEEERPDADQIKRTLAGLWKAAGRAAAAP
jgi:23S rRNA (pseudouridine1915-N3)-methyltransferase